MANARPFHQVLFAALILVCLAFGVWSLIYAVEKCGFWKTFLMGDSAFFAAISGMC